MRVVVDPDLRHNFVYRTTDLPMKRAFNAYSSNKQKKKTVDKRLKRGKIVFLIYAEKLMREGVTISH